MAVFSAAAGRCLSPQARPSAGSTPARSTVVSVLFMEGIEMLVLTRKSGEEVMIGDVRVRVVRVEGNRVRVAIEAPKEVQIRRAELDRKDK